MAETVTCESVYMRCLGGGMLDGGSEGDGVEYRRIYEKRQVTIECGRCGTAM